MSLLDELVKDPVAFGKKHALHPRNPPIDPGTWSKEKKVEDDTFHQVKGENRILWLKLTKSYYGPGGFSFDFSTTPKKDYRPIYWLPWGANRVYRTALRPSKKFVDPNKSFDYITSLVLRSAFSSEETRDRTQLEEDLRTAFALQETDPDLFFTATINGCSVFVEGTEEEPVVYHANAVDHILGFNQIDSGLAFATLLKEKIRHMVSRYRKFSEHQPKGPRTSTLPPSPTTGVVPTDYLVVGQDKNYMEWFKKEVRSVVKKYVKETSSFKIGMDSVKDVKLEEGAGTVFGVKKGGKWKFYYQKLVFVTCLQNRGVLKPDWREVSHWHVSECEQFWPGGSGYRFRF
jgi:hypothetical protein